MGLFKKNMKVCQHSKKIKNKSICYNMEKKTKKTKNSNHLMDPDNETKTGYRKPPLYSGYLIEYNYNWVSI